jgi:hypothetical protein
LTPAGAFFDLDGTLADTSNPHVVFTEVAQFRAWLERE